MNEFYKYRAFDEASLQSLAEGVIWVSNPKHFNDPFEYSFRIDPDMSFDEVSRRRRNATHENYLQEQMELIENIYNLFYPGGVYCLSEENCISLMWSHYSDSHKGFCVGYRVAQDNDLGNGNCHKVDYGRFKSISLAKLFQAFQSEDHNYGKDVFEAMVLSKDPNWEYEKEWRILYQQSDQFIKPNFTIASITFGLRMPQYQREIIKKIIKDESVIYYETKKRRDGYDLDIVPQPT
jgi:hypothetical protein